MKITFPGLIQWAQQRCKNVKIRNCFAGKYKYITLHDSHEICLYFQQRILFNFNIVHIFETMKSNNEKQEGFWKCSFKGPTLSRRKNKMIKISSCSMVLLSGLPNTFHAEDWRERSIITSSSKWKEKGWIIYWCFIWEFQIFCCFSSNVILKGRSSVFFSFFFVIRASTHLGQQEELYVLLRRNLWLSKRYRD